MGAVKENLVDIGSIARGPSPNWSSGKVKEKRHGDI